MNEEDTKKAKAILVKPVRQWTKDENKFIYQKIKDGHRDLMKLIRSEALLDG